MLVCNLVLEFCDLFLGHVPLNRLFPATLGFQNCFDQLANGALAASELRDVSGVGSDFSRGVGDGDTEADGADDGQVGKVVADVANLFGPQAAVANDLQRRGQLVFKALADDIDAELAGAELDDVTGSSRQQTETKSGPLPELDPKPVANAKALHFDALVVVPDRPIGQDAIDVGQNQFDAAASFG